MKILSKFTTSETNPFKLMRRATDVKDELLSLQGKLLFAVWSLLNSFYPIVSHLQKSFEKQKTVSFNPHINLSSFNTAKQTHSPQPLPWDSRNRRKCDDTRSNFDWLTPQFIEIASWRQLAYIKVWWTLKTTYRVEWSTKYQST